MKGPKHKSSTHTHAHAHAAQSSAFRSSDEMGANPPSQATADSSATPPTLDTLLLLEKVVQDSEQLWVENLNIIEHLIVNIAENYLNAVPELACTWKTGFIVRRLPTYLASSANTNQYAILLENFSFSLNPPSPSTYINPTVAASTLTPTTSSKSKHSAASVSRSDSKSFQGVSGTRAGIGCGSSLSSHSFKYRAHGGAGVGQDIGGGAGDIGGAWRTRTKNQQPGLVEIFSTPQSKGRDLWTEFVESDTSAFCSNKIFKEFARSFLDGFNKELARNSLGAPTVNDAPRPQKTTGQVQLIGPHLVTNLVDNPAIDKIFKLSQSKIPAISRVKVGKCTMSVDNEKCLIILGLDETKVVVRPGLFYNYGANSSDDSSISSVVTRLNKSIIERLPLHLPLFLNISQALTKGHLLFPTNCETMWTFGYWPAESNILAYFHPSSVPSRVLKLFSLYCLQPIAFLEFVSQKRSNSLVVLNRDPDEEDEGESGRDEDDGSDEEAIRLDSFTPTCKNGKRDGDNPILEPPHAEQLTIDFFIHCFLTELETEPNIEDWSPSAFPKRLHALLMTTVDSVEKCFFPNYFIRTNLLKGLGHAGKDKDPRLHSRSRSSTVDERRISTNIQDFIDDTSFGEEDELRLRRRWLTPHDEDSDGECGDNDDAFTLGEIDLRHYAEIQDDDGLDIDIEKRDAEFGIEFEELKIDDSESSSTARPGVSGTSTSNFHVVNPFTTFKGGREDEEAKASSDSKRKGSASGFGTLLKRLSQSLSKRSSMDANDAELHDQKRTHAAELEGFEESVTQSRREQSMGGHLPLGHVSVSRSARTYTNQGYESEPEGPESNVIHSSGAQLRRKAPPPPPDSVFKIIIERLCTNQLFYAVVIPPARRTGHGPQGHARRLLTTDLPTEEEEDAERERAALMIHMEQARRSLYAQDELVSIWKKTVSELIRPKYICPHTFSPRQIQYIGLLVNWVVKCTSGHGHGSLPMGGCTSAAAVTTTWEISGDILRTVLYQMRSEPSTLLHKQKLKLLRAKNGVKPKSFQQETSVPTAPTRGSKSQSMLARTLSAFVPSGSHSHGRTRGSYDICKTHHHHLLDSPESSVVNDDFEMATFGMDNPELASTHRLLQWLWQLRNSKIGRLSARAQKYMELLHEASLVNALFLEQWSSQNILQGLALKSAQAVTQIMETGSSSTLAPHVPLVAAWKRGWLWAEMVLSLVAWNSEKGIELKASVPIWRQDNEGVEYVYGYREKSIQMGADSTNTSMEAAVPSESTMSTSFSPASLKRQALEPDDNAVTLAYHSEVATPIGWNDFEDPRRPGPWTIPILIYSACGYYNQWEVIGGNIIQVMTRLQRFNSLQQVGSLLTQPHKKVALNEIRKLSKSSTAKTFQFDGNVMTKTFRRLASLRNTAKGSRKKGTATAAGRSQSLSKARAAMAMSNRNGNSNEGLRYLTCDRVGCPTSDQLPSSTSIIGKTIVTFHNCIEIECTKL